MGVGVMARSRRCVGAAAERGAAKGGQGVIRRLGRHGHGEEEVRGEAERRWRGKDVRVGRWGKECCA